MHACMPQICHAAQLPKVASQLLAIVYVQLCGLASSMQSPMRWHVSQGRQRSFLTCAQDSADQSLHASATTVQSAASVLFVTVPLCLSCSLALPLLVVATAGGVGLAAAVDSCSTLTVSTPAVSCFVCQHCRKLSCCSTCCACCFVSSYTCTCFVDHDALHAACVSSMCT